MSDKESGTRWFVHNPNVSIDTFETGRNNQSVTIQLTKESYNNGPKHPFKDGEMITVKGIFGNQKIRTFISNQSVKNRRMIYRLLNKKLTPFILINCNNE